MRAWVAVVLLILAGAPDRRSVEDGAGRSVTVPASPSRIVCLAPSVTEILFAVGAGPRVVGITDFCEPPDGASGIARIGGLINPDLERIVSLRPDLAIASTSGNYRDDVERIERLGIPVYTIHTPTVGAALETIEKAAALVGLPENGSRLAAGLRGRIEAVEARANRRSRPRTLFIIEPDPLIAPSGSTFLGEALRIAGADLVTADAEASWGQYDLEAVIEMKPEVILVPEAHRAWSRAAAALPRWGSVPAIALNQIYVVSDSIQHPGPRLVDGIEEVAAILDRIGMEKTSKGAGRR
jgi:iron complex transport system substrate-binding protein